MIWSRNNFPRLLASIRLRSWECVLAEHTESVNQSVERGPRGLSARREEVARKADSRNSAQASCLPACVQHLSFLSLLQTLALYLRGGPLAGAGPALPGQVWPHLQFLLLFPNLLCFVCF